ncbi:hypothetical protein QFZ67_000128 [Streptomyces sp. V1I1]|nr:hypothetical protein [Streptomyces sp. V1I1]
MVSSGLRSDAEGTRCAALDSIASRNPCGRPAKSGDLNVSRDAVTGIEV